MSPDNVISYIRLSTPLLHIWPLDSSPTTSGIVMDVLDQTLGGSAEDELRVEPVRPAPEQWTRLSSYATTLPLS